MKKNLIYSMITFIFTLILAEESSGIPAFARKYRMSCQTCHAPIPKLKAYGDEFAGNGFVLADQDAPRYFVDTGDEELSLIRDLPLAIRLEGYVTYNNQNSEQGDFASPYLIKLMSGGSLATDISYYFYFFFSERGEVAGVEDAYIMFNNLFGSELDIFLGQFQVSDPLFKRELRLTFEDYKIYDTNPGNSNINLTYDRGVMMTYGFDTGTNLVVEILNGSGIGEPDVLRNFDRDKYKNVFGRISQDVSSFMRIGGFGYIGKEEVEDNTGKGFVNKLWMAGPDVTFSYEDIAELNIQYMEREDDNPSISQSKIKTKGAFGELIIKPKGDQSKWYGVGLFNWIESDLSHLNYKSSSIHLGYMLRRNIRIVGEYIYNFTNEFGQVGLGFVSAF